jgi:hypothetical protein
MTHDVKRRRRDRAARVVLFTAVLTTVATSAPQDDRIEETATISLTAPEVRTFRVVMSRAAVDQADDASIEVSTRTTLGDGLEAVVVPDDEDVGDVASLTSHAAIVFTPKLNEVCSGSEACELGFTIDAEGESHLDVEVDVALTRKGDSSLVCPEGGFSDGATVEVFVGE